MFDFFCNWTFNVALANVTKAGLWLLGIFSTLGRTEITLKDLKLVAHLSRLASALGGTHSK